MKSIVILLLLSTSAYANTITIDDILSNRKPLVNCHTPKPIRLNVQRHFTPVMFRPSFHRKSKDDCGGPGNGHIAVASENESYGGFAGGGSGAGGGIAAAYGAPTGFVSNGEGGGSGGSGGGGNSTPQEVPPNMPPNTPPNNPPPLCEDCIPTITIVPSPIIGTGLSGVIAMLFALFGRKKQVKTVDKEAKCPQCDAVVQRCCGLGGIRNSWFACTQCDWVK